LTTKKAATDRVAGFSLKLLVGVGRRIHRLLFLDGGLQLLNPALETVCGRLDLIVDGCASSIIARQIGL
jgi:hypothetical protein